MKDSRKYDYLRATLAFSLIALLGSPAWGQLLSDEIDSHDSEHVATESSVSTEAPHEAIDSQPVSKLRADAATSRERLFLELAAEVKALEQKGALLRKVVSLVRPSVVHIEADKAPSDIDDDYGYEFDGATSYIEEAGSGVVVEIKHQYYILTNRHVIRDANLNRIRVQLADRRVLNPTQVWADDATDVAVLEIPAVEMVAARLASGPVEIGDFVLAFGSPFGLNHSVTHGIISAKGRRDLRLGDEKVQIQDFLQTDAAINPGNSGGPLLNLRGEVIGINTAIASNSGGNEGIGFSIPIHMAMLVAERLIEDGELIRAYLGVQLEASFNASKSAELGIPCGGTRVRSVSPGSPAEDASIVTGDVIVQFGDTFVEDDAHLVSLVGLTEIGTDVPVVLYRDGKEMTVMVNARSRH